MTEAMDCLSKMGLTKKYAMEINEYLPFDEPPKEEEIQVEIPGFVDFIPDKENIKLAGIRLLQLIDEGKESPLRIAEIKKFYESVFKGIEEHLRKAVLDELHKYSKGEVVSHLGAEFSEMESGVTYDYKNCGDHYVNWLYNELDARIAILKALKTPTELMNPQTGEWYTVNPPVRKSTTTYKVTFK